MARKISVRAANMWRFEMTVVTVTAHEGSPPPLLQLDITPGKEMQSTTTHVILSISTSE
ncbi:uncharacterized protein PHALS_07505 [Plasmopara halstedii]|uniref:Uncharacterized protein n=1 Tax=Plasmopara halstedii TaxID=4781 RepID=A0A0P1B4N1_PLAHL|nr:uncharacterized protein PHALS_07505 [Plasmopara halstedii]CEG49759.1 hypothetical protein PHALS_07505 [Plasmopara halstedii]|eukprot:XP_024586128.1 hypothetical protein PHALS_07505 [Plasmopara halstedii]